MLMKTYLKCTKCGMIKVRGKWVESITEENKIEKSICPRCSRILGRYYEAIIQLRGNINDDILKFIDKMMKNKKSFYRSEILKEGIDLYVERKAVAKSVAEQLKRNFKCKLKKSFKLITKRDGKDVYRTIILARF